MCTCLLIGLILTSCVKMFPSENSSSTPGLPTRLSQPLRSTSSPLESAKAKLFTVVFTVENFMLYAAEEDELVVQDVADALLTKSSEINDALDFDYQAAVVVEIFPDQDSLDQYGMNPEMQGFYAYSGDQHIQMVSPRISTPLPQIDYAQRVLIAVHEYTHLVLNAINSDLPIWLAEGTAIYIGPHDVYRYVCLNDFPFDQVPTFIQLEQSYGQVQNADLYAYSIVDFIANNYGVDKLNRLIRSPDMIEEILGETRTDIDFEWKLFIENNYSGN